MAGRAGGSVRRQSERQHAGRGRFVQRVVWRILRNVVGLLLVGLLLVGLLLVRLLRLLVERLRLDLGEYFWIVVGQLGVVERLVGVVLRFVFGELGGRWRHGNRLGLGHAG